MEAFNPNPPNWAGQATHSQNFCCPNCKKLAKDAKSVWLNRRSPVYCENHRPKWQEFYDCECGTPWWAWSSDRPPSEFATREFTE